MKRIVLIVGLIIGTILAINIAVMVNLMYNNPNFEGNAVVGYTIQILVFSVIYFGIRNYRDKQLGGVISFGKGFKTGALIVLVASTMYVVAWLIGYYLFVPDFIDRYAEHVINTCAKDQLEATKASMESFKKMYENPAFVVLITYAEVVPVGLLVALISALLLKKKTVGIQ